MPYAAQRRPRTGALLAAGALHLAALLWLVQLRPWADRGASEPEPAPLWVRLFEPRPPVPATVAPPPRETPRRATTARPRR
ncbi:MAG: hypothetical protein KGL18_03280, partial [Burkholderiales bacterium]|nr:hypothetical protein [Burkholderiales bacterium]